MLRHRLYLPPLDADLALTILLYDEVDLPQLLVRAVVVQPPLRSAPLFALQGCPEDDLGDLDQVPYVLRRVPPGVEEPRPPHLDVRQTVLEREHLSETLLQGLLVTHEVRVLHHGPLQLLLHEVGALVALGLLQRLEDALDLGPYLPLLDLRTMCTLLDVLRNPQAGAPAEDEQVGERVASKAVRPV